MFFEPIDVQFSEAIKQSVTTLHILKCTKEYEGGYWRSSWGDDPNPQTSSIFA